MVSRHVAQRIHARIPAQPEGAGDVTPSSEARFTNASAWVIAALGVPLVSRVSDVQLIKLLDLGSTQRMVMSLTVRYVILPKRLARDFSATCPLPSLVTP
jgi:hypothetical protein